MSKTTKAEARTLTDKIKNNFNEASRLMKEAHDKKVWIPLGYESFTEWLNKEIGISKSRGYQQLHAATLIESIRKAGVLPEGFALTDLQARKVSSRDREEFVSSLPLTADPVENAKLVLQEISNIPDPTPTAPVTTPVVADGKGQAATNPTLAAYELFYTETEALLAVEDTLLKPHLTVLESVLEALVERVGVAA